MIFSLIFVLRKYHISVNREKSRKYDIYVERFYENVVFHAVKDGFRSILQSYKRPAFGNGWIKTLQTFTRHFF